MYDLVALLSANNWTVSVAESCTAGMLAAHIVDQPHASDIFQYGFITYSDQAKSQLLGISSEDIKSYGAVSSEIAKLMATGAIKNSHSDFSVSITGYADGDDGGHIYIGIGSVLKAIEVHEYHFKGDRNTVRKLATIEAEKLLYKYILSLKKY
ncbi:MAG: CinA family protein [Anaplasmataceae bacterium]|nr:CinA family protein [Anaplasmataceae bacterium]